MIRKNRGTRRWITHVKAHKKEAIWGFHHSSAPAIFGKLRDGKVHCSCFLCSPKTKTHGFKPSDLRKIEVICYD